MSEFTTTPNLGLKKPNFDQDDDAWGDHWNENADAIDSAIVTYLPLAGGTMDDGALIGFFNGGHLSDDTSGIWLSSASGPTETLQAGIGSGDAAAGDTGQVWLYSGMASDGSSGEITLQPGQAAGAGQHQGDVRVLFPGVSGGATKGKFIVDGGAAEFTDTVTLADDPVGPLEAATKQYVDTLIVGAGIPDAPADTTYYARKDSGWSHIPFAALTGAASYAQLPAEVQQLPIAFPWAGKPAANASVYVPVAMALTIPAALAGSVAYAVTNPTSAATFTLSRIRSGSSTALGTVQIGTSGAVSLAGAGGSLVIGDVLVLTAPTAQDASLSDVGVTILAMRT